MAPLIDRFAGDAEVQRDQTREIECLCKIEHAAARGTGAPS
jgi:hypothetical protein